MQKRYDMPQHWRDLSVKEKNSLVAAGFAQVIGWALVVCGFAVEPLGDVSNSVLWILGQTLLFSSSVYSIAMYMGSRDREMRNEMQDHFNAMQSLMGEMDKFEEKYDLGNEGSTQDNTR